MLLKLAMKFLPKQYKVYADVGMRMFQHLNTKAEIEDAANFLVTSLKSDGHLSVVEWARFGGKLGIIGRRKPKKDDQEQAVAYTV
jgi:hypothetical protein